VIGCLQALEVIKIATHIGESLCGRILSFDALSSRFKTVSWSLHFILASMSWWTHEAHTLFYLVLCRLTGFTKGRQLARFVEIILIWQKTLLRCLTMTASCSLQILVRYSTHSLCKAICLSWSLLFKGEQQSNINFIPWKPTNLHIVYNMPAILIPLRLCFIYLVVTLAICHQLPQN
jgi:hypothetical protein